MSLRKKIFMILPWHHTISLNFKSLRRLEIIFQIVMTFQGFSMTTWNPAVRMEHHTRSGRVTHINENDIEQSWNIGRRIPQYLVTEDVVPFPESSVLCGQSLGCCLQFDDVGLQFLWVIPGDLHFTGSALLAAPFRIFDDPLKGQRWLQHHVLLAGNHLFGYRVVEVCHLFCEKVCKRNLENLGNMSLNISRFYWYW